MTALSTSLEEKKSGAKETLDEHVREIVQWHFDPDNGTPFWLDYAEKLDFDPRKDIHGSKTCASSRPSRTSGCVEVR